MARDGHGLVASAFLPLLAALLLLLVQAPQGQGRTASVAGIVRDDSGAVLPGAQVGAQREGAPQSSPVVVTTDAQGRFRFVTLAAGTYRFEVRVPGFRPVARTVTVRPSATMTLNFTVPLPPVTTSEPPPRPAQPEPPRPPSQAPRPRPPSQAPGPRPEPPVPPSTKGTPPEGGKAVIPVFYATDRGRAAGATLDYGSVRNLSGTLALGRYEVSVPRDHKMGAVERPTIWTLYREDPSAHFVIVSRRQQSSDDFYADIRNIVDRSSRKDAFVFIHGFNVAFEDAVFRTAQIAYDLGFDGAPILYSWPSNTGETPIGYTAAQNNNDWTVPHLDAFLRDVTARTRARRVHLVAHSMGNRALVNALNRMPPSTTKRFSQIMLTAPDIDAQTFVQLAAAVAANAERTTLYASSSDKALLVSKQLNAYPRAGDTGAGVVVVPGIDTVDVSAVDSGFIGHFYYGDNRSVISDIFLLITQGLPPMSRPLLQRQGAPPAYYWRFAR